MTMVDTNIVLDLVTRDSQWLPWSRRALVEARLDSRLWASAVVVGELAMRTASHVECLTLLRSFGIEPQALDILAAYRAGEAQRAYRLAGGRREMLLADFLIGAHAEIANVPLLTRDPRRYRAYFPDLKLIAPETENG